MLYYIGYVRKIADRIFLSQKPIPKKIFTGYECKTDNFEYYKPLYPFTKDNVRLLLSDSEEKLKVDYLKLLEESNVYQTIIEEQELDYLET